MNYKLNKLICSAAIVSSLMPLSACQKKSDNITLSNENELEYIINPFDWSKEPDYVNLELQGNYITIDIDTFYRLLNNSEKDFTIKGENRTIVLDKQILKEKIEQEFYEYNSSSLKDYLKVAVTIIEGAVLFIIGNKTITTIEKSKEKIKKLS